MRPIIIVSSMLAILAPGQLSAKDWQVELGGSWCLAQWDNELDG